ncbi:MAG TPA: hypothetical protein VFH88_10085 [Candidatus Krumholzibacteria bacterium]|nr:hypothetical protein [Candidatus Krumholzibacteria bacterium]
MTFRRSILVCSLALSTLVLAATSQAQGPLGPPGGLIYASGQLFKTVATPNDLPNHGRFEPIYVLGGNLINVAEAAPGEPGFVGGRWEVHAINWLTISPKQFMSAQEIHDAVAANQISIGPVLRTFECPLIPAN